MTVEMIGGRMTKSRAALAGGATGAWFGLLIAILVGMFSTGAAWVGIIVAGVIIGAVWGAIFGFVGHGPPAGSAISPPPPPSLPNATTWSAPWLMPVRQPDS